MKLEVCGCELDEPEVEHLLWVLAADGSEDAISAATTIRDAIDRNVAAIKLTAEECDTVLWVAQHPREKLGTLRAKLGNEYRDRHAA